jgi:hypothetical protein
MACRMTSLQMMLSDRPHVCCLRALGSNGFGKANLLSDLEILEFGLSDTVAMEIDLPPVGRCDEPVIAVWD